MTNEVEDELDLDVVLPQQFTGSTPTAVVLRAFPSARLWLSATIWAVREAGGGHKRISSEALAWLQSKSEEPRSFIWIAQCLCVEPEPWRRRLLAVVDSLRKKRDG